MNTVHISQTISNALNTSRDMFAPLQDTPVLNLESSIPLLFLINGSLIVLIITAGFIALHLMFKHVDDKEIETTIDS